MSGKRSREKIPPEEALSVFKRRDDSARPLTATDIMDELGWSRRTVHNKLDVLVERGEIETRKVGARGRVWWVPQTKNVNLDSDVRAVSTSDTEKPDPGPNEETVEKVDESATQTPTPEESPSSAIPTSGEEILDLYRHDIPGHGDEKQKRAQVIATAYEYLREQKRVHIDDVKEYTYSKYPDEASAQRQWDNYLREGLKRLPGVEPPPSSTSGIWHYIEPGGELDQMLQMELDDPVKEVAVPPKKNPSRGRRVLVQIAYDYLKEEKRAYKDDFERILPDEYIGHYRSFQSGLWERCLRDALQSLPGVVSPPRGGAGLWTYIKPGSELDEILDVEIEPWVKKTDVKGDGRVAEIQRSLIQIAYNHIKLEGEATKTDIESALPDYSGHYSNFDGLWSYCLKDSLENASDITTSKSGDNRATLYQYVE